MTADTIESVEVPEAPAEISKSDMIRRAFDFRDLTTIERALRKAADRARDSANLMTTERAKEIFQQDADEFERLYGMVSKAMKP